MSRSKSKAAALASAAIPPAPTKPPVAVPVLFSEEEVLVAVALFDLAARTAAAQRDVPLPTVAQVTANAVALSQKLMAAHKAAAAK